MYKFKSEIETHYKQHYIITQIENLNLSNKLHVIRMVGNGITFQATTNKFDVDLSIASKVLQARDQLETDRKRPRDSRPCSSR